MALKTDYKDAIPDTSVNEHRVFDLVDSNGNVVAANVHFEEKTVYSEDGDKYGSLDINEQNETINENSEAIEQINDDLSAEITNRTNAVSAEATARQNGDNAKVNKSGDAMTGNLTIKNTAPAVFWDKLDSNGNREVMVQANISSAGDFYLYNNLLAKNIVKCTKAGVITFDDCSVKNMRARMPIYGTTYGRGALSDALSVNLNSPDGDENKVGYVYTGYTNSLPSDCAHGIREVFYYNSSNIYIQITGVTPSGYFKIWGNFYNGSSWTGWRCP